MPSPVTSNRFADARRHGKAFGISRIIWSALDRDERLNPALTDRVGALDEPARRALAEAAGVNPPSDLTWALVCEMLRDRQADERRWLGQLDDARAVS